MSTIFAERIHPTAVIDPLAELDDDVRIGPYSIIEGPVSVGAGTVIEGHACLTGPMEMGRDNLVGHGAVLGKSPQHKGYRGELTRLIVGDGNVFREHVTVHRGTEAGGGETVIGDRNLLMVGAHVGHDARVGNDCTLVNGALIGGHVELYDGCIISGNSAVQQRVRVGRLAMLGGLGSTSKDIPPFILQMGINCVAGLNIVGLRRAGISNESIRVLHQAFRVLYKEGRTQSNALARITSDFGQVPEVLEFVEFIVSSGIGINPSREPARYRRAL